jgi:glucose-6-phosphate dehydrogenase assembly protein OpcA
MATTYKVLGQSAPSATTATTLYTVPSSTQAVVSTIAVCNRGGSSATFRVAIRPNGDALATSHYIAYDSAVTANNSTFITIGVTLGDTDVITVYASTADLTFSAFGSEIA